MGNGVVVGVLYPGYAAEDDYPAAEKLLSVTLPVAHTSMDSDEHSVEALLDVGRDDRLADGADRLRPHQPDSVVWACTSGSFVFGWEGAHAQVDTLGRSTGVPSTSTSLAFVEAARALGLRRVAIAATYPDALAEHFRDFLGAADIEVVQLRAADIVTATEVGARDIAHELVVNGDHPDAEAVFVPDTALHTIGRLPELEQAVGKPVLTANQVSIWEGLRLAGGSVTHPRLGALFG